MFPNIHHAVRTVPGRLLVRTVSVTIRCVHSGIRFKTRRLLLLENSISSVWYLNFVRDVCVCVEVCVLMCSSLTGVCVHVLRDLAGSPTNSYTGMEQ